MTSVEELLSISSEGLAPEPRTLAKILEPFSLGPELFHMLECKNGFYAFESALHVFFDVCDWNEPGRMEC
jgi:hypothetical protein